MSCFRPWSWSVLALFETSVLALDVAVWVAELGPEAMFPPAVEDGALPLTAFWLLNAAPAAHWLVSAIWTPSLEAAGAAAAGQARAPADVLAEVLVLVGLGLVRDVG